jgi:hypothetical protein
MFGLRPEPFVAAFDPDQPRDEQGQWTEGGGGGGGGASRPEGRRPPIELEPNRSEGDTYGGSIPNRAHIERALDRLPDEDRRGIRRIVFSDNVGPENPHTGGHSAADAHMDGTLTFYRAQSWGLSGRMDSNITVAEEVFYHETGHTQAMEQFGDHDPYTAAYGRPKPGTDILTAEPVDERVERARQSIRDLDKYEYDRIKREMDGGHPEAPHRPPERLGKRLTKAEIAAYKEWRKADFKKTYGLTWEEAKAGDIASIRRIQPYGRHIDMMYFELDREDNERVLRAGKTPHVLRAREYVAAVRGDGVWASYYAEAGGRSTGLTEDYAESYALWTTDPTQLKRRFPKRYEWFKKHHGNRGR